MGAGAAHAETHEFTLDDYLGLEATGDGAGQSARIVWVQAPPYDEIGYPSQTYHDLFVTWISELSGHTVSRALAGTELQLGICNVFDKTPPFDANVYNTFRTYHSPLGEPLGRSYQVAITKRFLGYRFVHGCAYVRSYGTRYFTCRSTCRGIFRWA